MDIGATDSSSANLNNDVEGRSDLGLGGFVELQVLVVSDDLYDLHGGFDLLSSLLGSRWLWVRSQDLYMVCMLARSNGLFSCVWSASVELRCILSLLEENAGKSIVLDRCGVRLHLSLARRHPKTKLLRSSLSRVLSLHRRYRQGREKGDAKCTTCLFVNEVFLEGVVINNTRLAGSARVFESAYLPRDQ